MSSEPPWQLEDPGLPVATQHASDPFPCLPSLGTKQQLKAKEKSSFVTFLLLLPWKDKMDLPVVDTGAEKCPRDWPRAFPWSPSSFRPSMPTLSALSCQKTGMNKLCSHPSEPSAQWNRTKSTNYDTFVKCLKKALMYTSSLFFSGDISRVWLAEAKIDPPLLRRVIAGWMSGHLRGQVGPTQAKQGTEPGHIPAKMLAL